MGGVIRVGMLHPDRRPRHGRRVRRVRGHPVGSQSQCTRRRKLGTTTGRTPKSANLVSDFQGSVPVKVVSIPSNFLR